MLKTRTRQIVVIGVLLALTVAVFIPVLHRVDAKAEVVPLSSAKIRARTGGYLREVYVSAGDRVVSGQRIALLEDENLRQRLIAGENKVEGLQIQIARASKAGDPNLSAKLRLDLDAAMMEAASLAEHVASLELVSPIDGIVLAVGLDRRMGDYIPRGRELCEVIEPRAMRVSISLEQGQMRSVKADDTVEVRFRTYGGERFVSRISHVVTLQDTEALAAQGAPSSPQGFRAYVDLENPGTGNVATVDGSSDVAGYLGRLKPGMTGDASIIVGSRTLGSHIIAKIRGMLKSDLLFF